MSGGVDSAVSAAWLKKQGYDVIGISLQLHDMSEDEDNKFGTCCSLSDIADARRVAEAIGFPFYVADMESRFEESVIDDFVQEYLHGRTPNPCVKCNEKVKFSYLMDWAMDLGADYLATGHFANVGYDSEHDQFRLMKGSDIEKDQSYFLFTMKQKDLAKTYFPVGHLTKDQVRELAHELELRVANKPDSQEICFVQSRSYADFIEERVPKSMISSGHIVDLDGRVLATHDGVHQFTIGQRKGLGLSGKDPMYVIDIRPEQKEVVVGPNTALFKKRCIVSNMNWINPPHLEKPRPLKAKVRYRSVESPILMTPLLDNRIEVVFETPQRAITPGQALVIYESDHVLGGGWIEEVDSQ